MRTEAHECVVIVLPSGVGHCQIVRYGKAFSSLHVSHQPRRVDNLMCITAGYTKSTVTVWYDATLPFLTISKTQHFARIRTEPMGGMESGESQPKAALEQQDDRLPVAKLFISQFVASRPHHMLSLVAFRPHNLA